MQVSSVQAPARFDEQGTGGPGNAVSFEGFDPPESNFWRLPNNWFDLAARFTSWAEHKVVEYILRHTWGYHEYGIAKLITMDEFMHGRKRRDGSRLDAGCGMAENSIKKGIADAVAHGFLVVQIDDSDRGRIKKYYAPRMRRPHVDEGAHSVPIGGQPLIGQDQSLTPTPQSLIPAPQILPLQDPEPIPTAQALIPRHPALDPRTEETLLETHPQQDTRSNNQPVVVLPAQDRGHHQGRDNHPRHSGSPTLPSYSSPASPPSVTHTPPPTPRGRIRDRAGQAASASRPANIPDPISGHAPSRATLLPAQDPVRGNSPHPTAPAPPLRLTASPTKPPWRLPSHHAAQSREVPLDGEISTTQSLARHANSDSGLNPVQDRATYRKQADARPTDRGRRNAAIRPQSEALAGAAPADHMQAIPYRSEAPNPLIARLVAEGIGTPKARALVATVPTERIERQLAWIDGRSYRDRAATLVASIESDFTAPPPPRRAPAAEDAGFDRGKYYRGSYALCPHCGARPCAPTCDASQPPAARRG